MLSKNDAILLKKIKVLYVEDEEDILKFTTMVLEDYILELSIAKNGKEALEILKQKNIDLIITDILMPKLNGIDLIREIRKKSICSPAIIVVTAHTETQYLLDCIELGVDGYILKPIDVNELFKAIIKATLPKFQADELHLKNTLLNALSIFVGGKKIEIIKYLIENSDENNIFYGSYEDILKAVKVSKPTVVKTFRQLIDTGLLIKIKNKIYKLQADISHHKKDES